jgi:hypothetical protein
VHLLFMLRRHLLDHSDGGGSDDNNDGLDVEEWM